MDGAAAGQLQGLVRPARQLLVQLPERAAVGAQALCLQLSLQQTLVEDVVLVLLDYHQESRAGLADRKFPVDLPGRGGYRRGHPRSGRVGEQCSR